MYKFLFFSLIVASSSFNVSQQVLSNWINCQDFCSKISNNVPDWYRSFSGLNKCVCMEKSSIDELIDESKLLTVRDNPLICAQAGASCESCCKKHLGLTDWDKSFTDRRPNLCMCKINPDEMFESTIERSNNFNSRKIRKDLQKVVNDNNKYLDKYAQPQICRNAGPSCEFCCRKNSKITDWNRSFKGNNECICKSKD